MISPPALMSTVCPNMTTGAPIENLYTKYPPSPKISAIMAEMITEIIASNITDTFTNSILVSLLRFAIFAKA